MDGENRIARTALQLGIDVNNATINVRDSEVLPESLQAEFNDLWQDWFHRSDDLFWNRNDRIYKRIVNQIEDGRVEREDVRWDRRRDRYPELPVGTIANDTSRSVSSPTRQKLQRALFDLGFVLVPKRVDVRAGLLRDMAQQLCPVLEPMELALCAHNRA